MQDTVNPASLALIADIGGTNARFALTDLLARAAQVLDARSLDASALTSLQYAAEHYLAAVGVQPRHAAIAVASPVNGEEIRLTSRAWSFTRREPRPRPLRTLARFCAVLGSVAGDAALIHGARAVTLAGGIVPRFIPFLRSSAFRERFLAKGRFAAYLESVTIRVITHSGPGLLGAAMSLRASDSSNNISNERTR